MKGYQGRSGQLAPRDHLEEALKNKKFTSENSTMGLTCLVTRKLITANRFPVQVPPQRPKRTQAPAVKEVEEVKETAPGKKLQKLDKGISDCQKYLTHNFVVVLFCFFLSLCLFSRLFRRTTDLGFTLGVDRLASWDHCLHPVGEKCSTSETSGDWTGEDQKP